MRSRRGVELSEGELVTLLASAAHTVEAGVRAAAFTHNGDRRRFLVMLAVTDAATAVDDTLDVYIDFLAPDATTWINGGHFPQVLGNGGAKTYCMIFDATNPGTTCIDVTADAAVDTVRPGIMGTQISVRDTVVGATASFTFAVTMIAL